MSNNEGKVVLTHPKGASAGSGHSFRIIRWSDGSISLSAYFPMLAQIRNLLRLERNVEFVGFRLVRSKPNQQRYCFKVEVLRNGDNKPNTFRTGPVRSNWSTSAGLEPEDCCFGLEVDHQVNYMPEDLEFVMYGEALYMWVEGGHVQHRLPEKRPENATVDKPKNSAYVLLTDEEWESTSTLMAANNRKTNRTTVDIILCAAVQAGVVSRKHGV